MGQTMRVVAIAKSLQRRGHDIRFIAAGKLIPVIKNFGIDVLEAESMPEIAPYSKPQAATGMDGETLVAMAQDVMGKIMQLEVAMALKEKPQLIVSGTISGPSAARQVGVPSLLTILQPHGEKTLHMFKSRMLQQGEQAMKKIVDGLFGMMGAADMIVLEGMPEISGGVNFKNYGPVLHDLKDKIRFAGPLLVEEPDRLPERGSLKQVHIGGPDKQMAYITIGGGSALIGEQFLKTVLDALRLIPEVTGVIATGIDIPPATVVSYNPPGNALIRGFVPGTEMIKASDVTVFHGGSSTLMTCIACGTPAVVIPSMAEQEDNGNVLAQAGAGIVLDKQALTPAMLAEAIQRILQDNSYRTCARELKMVGKKYGGAGAAADWAEQLVKVSQ